MLYRLFKENILKNFFSIQLSGLEKEVAEMSVKEKYVRVTKQSAFYTFLSMPLILFMDSGVVMDVLIPVTIVAGTAWYSVTLTSVKKKFELFGFELTVDLFRAFTVSLFLLAALVLVKINPLMFDVLIAWGSQLWWMQGLAGILGTFVVVKLLYDIFLGSLKYDINDSMLAGQSEAAENFFKRSLSLMTVCADHLKTKHDEQVSHYYIGLAFYEIFSYVMQVKGRDKQFEDLLLEAQMLKENPSMPAVDGKAKSVFLITQFLQYASGVDDERAKKSFYNVQSELYAMINNVDEKQELTNIRLAVVFEEMRDMIDSQGESLFNQRIEVEKKYIIDSAPEDLAPYERKSVRQGYLVANDKEEVRLRQMGDRYYKTVKRYHPSGYRDEIEVFITQEAFEKEWPATEGKRVEKTRYYIPIVDSDLMIEFDIFHGANEGLMCAEVEFASEEEADSFVAPAWFAKDVTMDKNFKNKNLAK